ncbi:MAG: recombinase family protein [Clostridia bacterium]
MKYKVVAYLRLSKEEFNNEKESNSIINQRKMIDDYLEDHEEYKLVDYYIDDGYSGTNFNRPEFQRMIKEIKVIVVKDLSRFGRNYIETGNYLEVILPTMGVSVISINENCEIDSSSYYGSDYVPLKSLLNDMYAKDIFKKVRK